MDRIISEHDNSKEDRYMDVFCTENEAYSVKNCSGFVTEWTEYDQDFFFEFRSTLDHCVVGKTGFLIGSQNTHSNDLEDRRFIFRYAIPNNDWEIDEYSCKWKKANSLDGPFDTSFVAPFPYNVITGIHSFHSNSAEDRVFYFRFCRFLPRTVGIFEQSNFPKTGMVKLRKTEQKVRVEPKEAKLNPPGKPLHNVRAQVKPQVEEKKTTTRNV